MGYDTKLGKLFDLDSCQNEIVIFCFKKVSCEMKTQRGIKDIKERKKDVFFL